MAAELNNKSQKSNSMVDLMNMFYGFQHSQVLYTSVTLGVFEVLHHYTGPMSAEALAARLGAGAADPSALARLMNACVALNLLSKTAGDEAGRPALYSNTAATEKFLVKSSPTSMRAQIVQIGGLYAMWGNLVMSVREGKCPMTASQQFSFEEPVMPEILDNNCINGFYSTQTKQLEFLQAMHMFSSKDAPHVVQAFDLARFSSACDLGGGTGAIASHIALEYQQMSVIVFDLPRVILTAPHFLTERPENLKFQSGDFFEDDLPSCDLFILSHVIHDWTDDKLEALLKKVYDTLPIGGALLVLEKCLHEDKTSPVSTVFFDLGMMVCSGGRERTSTEYKSLLKKHGFSNIQTKLLAKSMWRDAILAWKE